MKQFTFALVSALGLLATASPVPLSRRLLINDRAAVTAAEMSILEFYAQYAGSSYCNSEVTVGSTITCSDDVCSDVEAAGAKVLATFSGDVTDIQGFVSSDDTNKLIVASFRGSSSIRNWIADLSFILVSCDLVSGCLTHAGFLTAYKEISSALLAALKKAVAANPTYKIVFTGHSLGGAVATLAAGYARKQGYAADLYTYGSPRVGNKAFVSYVTNQTGSEYRVTHLDDPVPRLPPIILNYRHTSPEYWLSTGTSNTTSYTAADVQVCEGFSNTKCNAGTGGLDIAAHLHYFEAISGCGAGGLSWKRETANVTSDMATTAYEAVTDEDLQTRLEDWVSQDKEYAESLDE
ncbi:alpha/beta-hydrolase [Annulohypoxylon maeteangense]|uniref:alpha/beta-hydrolase n=1 Tax=Annulohypoxylon maeteangense TaxID=1927788 RepID=UPI002008B398|nr:alpha/beta-hydrolase [Annulohypoxylon maeteangense]KAI0883192.1 alpha/beta-hydrolase [Annulohypoxylon maeteangense]